MVILNPNVSGLSIEILRYAQNDRLCVFSAELYLLCLAAKIVTVPAYGFFKAGFEGLHRFVSDYFLGEADIGQGMFYVSCPDWIIFRFDVFGEQFVY
jgi:hypothetical protein